MATYQLAGSQDPAARIDRVVVESPTDENPDGKILELNGEPKELSDDQYSKLARFVRLQPVPAADAVETNFVDQPGVEQPSQSTDVPPDPGTTPDIDSLTKVELEAELARVQAEGSLQDVSPNANKADLAKALRKHYGLEG